MSRDHGLRIIYAVSQGRWKGYRLSKHPCELHEGPRGQYQVTGLKVAKVSRSKQHLMEPTDRTRSCAQLNCVTAARATTIYARKNKQDVTNRNQTTLNTDSGVETASMMAGDGKDILANARSSRRQKDASNCCPYMSSSIALDRKLHLVNDSRQRLRRLMFTENMRLLIQCFHSIQESHGFQIRLERLRYIEETIGAIEKLERRSGLILRL